MSKMERTEQDLVRAALASSNACPPLDELESAMADGSAIPATLQEHLKSCAHCQTELELQRVFHSAVDTNCPELQKVTAALRQLSSEIFISPRSAGASKGWWLPALRGAWFAPAALGITAVLLVAGTVLHYRQQSSEQISIEAVPNGSEVTRSSSFALLSPTGDLPEPPKEIRWESVSSAARYRIKLREVDETEIWTTETSGDHVEIPSDARSRMLPKKTVFCEIVAFDATGHEVGDTGPMRMRVMPGVRGK